MCSCCIFLKTSLLPALLMCYTCVKNSYGATNTCSYCLCHHQHHTPSQQQHSPCRRLKEVQVGPHGVGSPHEVEGWGVLLLNHQSVHLIQHAAHHTEKCFANNQSIMSLHQWSGHTDTDSHQDLVLSGTKIRTFKTFQLLFFKSPTSSLEDTGSAICPWERHLKDESNKW